MPGESPVERRTHRTTVGDHEPVPSTSMLKSVYERVGDMAASTESVDLVGDEAATNLARAALFAALVGAFAYVTFPNPVSPVSVTLQVLGVFLAGIYLGPVWGAASLVLYLAAGAVGAPVFQGGSAGVGQLVGQSAGYLWSYPVAAAAIGAIVHRGTTLRDLDGVGVPTLVGAMTVGTAIIYAVGVTGLAVVLSLGPVEAVTVGAAAFLPAEALKIAAAGLRDHVAEAGPATHLGLVSDPDQFVLRAAAVERVVGREGRAERRGSGDAEPGTDRDIGLDRDVDVAPVQVREHVLDRADRPLLAVDRSGTGVGGGSHLVSRRHADRHPVCEGEAGSARSGGRGTLGRVRAEEGRDVAGNERGRPLPTHGRPDDRASINGCYPRRGERRHRRR